MRSWSDGGGWVLGQTSGCETVAGPRTSRLGEGRERPAADFAYTVSLWLRVYFSRRLEAPLSTPSFASLAAETNIIPQKLRCQQAGPGCLSEQPRRHAELTEDQGYLT